MKKIVTLFTSLLFGAGVYAQQLNNSSFDNWAAPSNPDSWSTWESATLAPLGLASKDTVDKVDGTASIKLITDSIQAGPGPKLLVSGFVNYGAAIYAPPVLTLKESPFTGKPDTIFFSYKYVPVGNDTALVNITASGPSGSLLNGGFLLPSTAGVWRSTYAVLTPNYSAGVVDSFSLMFKSSKGVGIQGSALHVDGIRLGYKPVTGINAVAEDIHLELFPNPVSDLLTIVTDADMRAMTFELLDVTGKVIASKTLNSAKNTLACGEFQTGTYFYRVVSASGTVKNGSVAIVR